MLEFILLVILANLAILGCLYILRHVIAIRAPVLFMAVGISIFLCVLYPFLVARVPYPQIIYLYTVLILAGAATLCRVENKYFAPGEVIMNQAPAASPGDVLAAAEGAPEVEVCGVAFPGLGRTGLNVDIPAVEEKAGPPAEKTAEEAVKEVLEETEKDTAGETSEKTAEEAAAEVMEEAAEEVFRIEAFVTAPGPAPEEPWLEEPEPKEPEPEGLEPEGPEPEGFEPEEPEFDESEFEQPVHAFEEAAPAGGPEVAWEVSSTDLVSPHLAEEKQQPEAVSGEGTGEADTGAGQDIRMLVTRAFDALGAGDRSGAAESFFKALQLNPAPKLAAMICIEISSIYMAEGRRGQALAVMEMVRDVWGSMLDETDMGRIKTIIIQLRREVQ